MKKVKRIFISKQAGIGDVILLTPVLAELKRLHPQCQITLMTFPNAVELVDGLPFIDEVFVYDKKKDSSWSVIRKMRGHDMAIFFDLQYRPVLLAFLARIPVRIGLAHKRKFWLTHALEWQEHMDHIYEPYASAEVLARSLGIKMDEGQLDKLHFTGILPEEESALNGLLQEMGMALDEPYIACSPLTALFLKDWPQEKWRQLFSLLYEKYKTPVVVFGSFGEKNASWDMPGVINLAGKTSLRQAVHVVRKARLLVNSCSLPIHMAAAYETPCVVLYGHTDPKRWAPRRNCTVIMADLPCSPCDGYKGSSCKDPICMQAIEVETVFQACCDWLEKRQETKHG